MSGTWITSPCGYDIFKILFLTFLESFRERRHQPSKKELPMPEFLGQDELVLSHRVQVNPASQIRRRISPVNKAFNSATLEEVAFTAIRA
jgi:hypothetical protein